MPRLPSRDVLKRSNRRKIKRNKLDFNERLLSDKPKSSQSENVTNTLEDTQIDVVAIAVRDYRIDLIRSIK